MTKPLKVGDRAPSFEAPDQEGRTHTLQQHLGRPFVLYFYPKDETPGCIAQGCAFRDAWADFRKLDVDVLGVSRDSVESHRSFAAKGRFQYTLLSDESGRMHRDFGALLLGALPRRISYLVDADGRIAAAYSSHLQPAAHAEKMLAVARTLATRA